MSWVEPIYDRTELDVVNKTPKGHLNATDLTRIEGNLAVLADLLDVEIHSRNWTQSDFPTPLALKRILDDLRAVRDAYYVYSDTPNIPNNPINHFNKVNDIEKIQAALWTLWNENAGALIYAGELYSGQSLGVL